MTAEILIGGRARLRIKSATGELIGVELSPDKASKLRDELNAPAPEPPAPLPPPDLEPEPVVLTDPEPTATEIRPETEETSEQP